MIYFVCEIYIEESFEIHEAAAGGEPRSWTNAS